MAQRFDLLGVGIVKPLPNVDPSPHVYTQPPFDADGDGDDDILLVGRGTLRVLFNDGARGLRLRPAQRLEPGPQLGAGVPVDVDGDGFVPNKDTLGHPLPVKFVAEK